MTSPAPSRLPWPLRVAVRLLDPEFRRRFGSELEATLAETWHRDAIHRSRPARSVLLVRLLADIMRRGLAQRLFQTGHSRRSPPRREASVVDTVVQDLRHALRAVRADRMVALTAILILGLGIGSVTTVFSAINAELLRALPYPDPDRLVFVQEEFRGSMRNTSGPNLEDWRDQAAGFESMTGFDDRKVFTILGGGEPVRAYGAAVDGEFFRVLGVEPILGRTLSPADDVDGAPRVVVLGEGLWQRQFGADSAVVGRSVTMNQLPYVVVGVIPASFRIPDQEEVWVPLRTHPFGDDRIAYRGARVLEVIGRLGPEATLESARATMTTVARRLAASHPDTNREWGAVVMPLREEVLGRTQPMVLAAAFGAVLILLALTCVNVASLLIARFLRRRREIDIRMALGAGRTRIVRQVLAESLIMATAGGMVGLGFAVWGQRLVIGLLPAWFPRLADRGIDPTVLAVTAAITLLSGLAAGLAPALFAVRRAADGNRLEEDTRTGQGRRHRRVHDALVAVEVALALVLLVGAGLLIRSSAHIGRVPLGFDPNPVLMARIDLPLAEYPEGPATEQFFRETIDRLASHHTVAIAAASSRLPLAGSTSIGTFQIQGIPETMDDPPSAHLRVVTPGLFATLGIPILRGRDFRAAERSEPVVIVDRELAERHWSTDDVLGRQIRVTGDAPWRTVIGVVGRTRHWGPRYDPTPTLYFPHGAMPSGSMMLAIRGTADPAALAPLLGEEIRRRDPKLAISELQTMDDAVSGAVASARFSTTIFTLFAVFAMVLASLGLYAVIALGVAHRQREIGVRVALGARGADVARHILGHGVSIALVGVGIGTGVALAAANGLEGLLFGVRPWDLVTFTAAPALVVAVAVAASLLPARRAARLDPVTALRTE